MQSVLLHRPGMLTTNLRKKTMSRMCETIGVLLRGRRFYIAVAVCCLLEWLALSKVAPNVYFDSDTVSYFYPVNLFIGRISAIRPPVYCLFLNALRVFGDIHLKAWVVSSQFVLMLGTLLLAAKMLRTMFRHEIPVLVASGLLALQGYFWSKAIDPECFSFCVTVFAIYLYWRMTVAPSKKIVWGLNLLIAFAVLLKPVFMVLAIALFLAWAFRIFAGDEDRGRIKSIVFSYGISVAIVIGYCFLMQGRHGMFGVSSVSLQNDLLDIVSSSAWQNCGDSPVKRLLADEMGKSRDPYAGAFALQWAVIPTSKDTTDLYATCPEFLFESGNVQYCYNLQKQYTKGALFSLDALQGFIREAKHQPLYYKYELQKLFLAIGAPQGVLLVPFWLGAASLVIAWFRRDHVLFFSNLLFLGFIASVIFKSDMEQNARLLYPVCMVPLMDLLCYFKSAIAKVDPTVLHNNGKAIEGT